MDILDFAESIERELELRRYPNQKGRWMCKFANSSILEGKYFLLGTYGNGRSPAEAIKDYCIKLQGQVLITEGNTKHENRFKVPEKLIYEN